MIEFLLMAVLIPPDLPSLPQSGKITDVYKYIFEHILSIVDNGRNLIRSFHIVVCDELCVNVHIR